MKITIIGYNTYDTNHNFAGGTEMITDTLIRYFISKNADIQYFVTRRLTATMKNLYESDYNCELHSKKDLSIECINNFNPDLVVVSICSYDTKDICKDVISKLDYPVLVYGHGPNCCYITNYNKEVINKNFYFSYLSEKEHQQYLDFGLSEDKIFRITNPVVLSNIDFDYSISKEFDAISNVRLVPEKGLLNSLELCKSLNWKIDVIGSASNKSKVLQEVYKYNKAKYFGLVSRKEVINHLKNSKFSIFLPNTQEGESPLSVLESMALGVPVITWDDFGIKNVVDPEYNIILEHSSNYIEQFIEEYLPKIDRYTSCDNCCKLSEVVNNKFGLESYYKKLDEIISKIRR